MDTYVRGEKLVQIGMHELLIGWVVKAKDTDQLLRQSKNISNQILILLFILHEVTNRG